MFEGIQQFAKRTGLTPTAIRRMVIADQLPHIMVGNRYMIHVEKATTLLSKMADEIIEEIED